MWDVQREPPIDVALAYKKDFTVSYDTVSDDDDDDDRYIMLSPLAREEW